MRAQLAFVRTGLEIDLPDSHEYSFLQCPSIAALADPLASIESVLDRPVAGPSLATLAAGKHTAAISVCDITRPAPNPVVLPPLLRRLQAAGIPKEGIRILIATGLHRAATPAEIRHIVGEETASNFEVLNHDARNAAQHRRIGTTQSGTPVFVDERFIGADLHLSLGFIEPHLMLGFSGGRKLVAPGLAAEATIKELHSSRFMRDPRAREGSIDDNPLHAELLEIARMARHDFIVDVSLTRDRKIAAVFAGEPIAAHRTGVQWVSKALMQTVDKPFDAVITTGAGFPLDMTFYQSIKGITAASQIVRQGGNILLFGACDEGVGAPEFTRMVCEHTSDTEFLRSIEGVPVTIDQWQLEKLALATQKAKVSYCVPGVPEQFIRGLWGPGFRDPSEAVKALFTELPESSRIAVVPEGPYVLAEVA